MLALLVAARLARTDRFAPSGTRPAPEDCDDNDLVVGFAVAGNLLWLLMCSCTCIFCCRSCCYSVRQLPLASGGEAPLSDVDRDAIPPTGVQAGGGARLLDRLLEPLAPEP
jgi:hypothetical protein